MGANVDTITKVCVCVSYFSWYFLESATWTKLKNFGYFIRPTVVKRDMNTGR